MISDRVKGVKNLVLISQCCLVTAAFWAWFLLCYDPPMGASRLNQHLIYNLFVLLGLVVESRSLRSELNLRLPAFEETARRSIRQLGVTLFYLFLYLVAEQSVHISRFFLFSFIPLLFLILFFTNHLLPRKLGQFSYYKKMRQSVILLGPVAKARQLHDWFKDNEHLGLQVRGLLTEDQVETSASSLPILGQPADLDLVLGAPGLHKVIIVEFPRNGDVRRYADVCEAHGSRLLVVADLDAIFGHSVAVFEDAGKFFLGLREEPLEDPINRFLKRCLDIAVSLPVVVFVLPPLMLFVWLCQRIQSPGPLFFWQPRDGINSEPFDVLKFRSMHVRDASDVRLPSAKDDPRLYPAGSFLRKTSLDEFPQFWNVLRGSMSVVGPRPHLKSYNDQYRQVCFKAYVRALVKPGITGLAQARGFRGDAKTSVEVVSRIESDIEYLENWSFWLDLWLVIRTALQIVIPPKGAI
jgi:exopolysaccharide biosynthesis polyprenyl glycosylphosphotransferase